MNQGELLSLLRALSVDESNPGVPRSRLVEEATKRFEVEEETVETAISTLKKHGEIYTTSREPDEQLRPTDTGL
jgi:DNA replicative helicase MCM subunit Mcm2 (Cdc46/Mcm family)